VILKQQRLNTSPRPDVRNVAPSTMTGHTVPKYNTATAASWKLPVHPGFWGPKSSTETGFVNPQRKFTIYFTTAKFKAYELPDLKEFNTRYEDLDDDMEHVWGPILRGEL
jgi:hypothetical protein